MLDKSACFNFLSVEGCGFLGEVFFLDGGGVGMESSSSSSNKPPDVFLVDDGAGGSSSSPNKLEDDVEEDEGGFLVVTVGAGDSFEESSESASNKPPDDGAVSKRPPDRGSNSASTLDMFGKSKFFYFLGMLEILTLAFQLEFLLVKVQSTLPSLVINTEECLKANARNDQTTRVVILVC